MDNPFLTGSLHLCLTINTLEWFERVYQEQGSTQSPRQHQATVQSASATVIGINTATVDLMPRPLTDVSTYVSVNREETDDFVQPYVTDVDGFLMVDLPSSVHPAVKSPKTDNSEQPYMTTISNLPEFYIIEFPSFSKLGLPKSDYFPVSHVVLNSVDLSLTVANVGLCVMIYTFLPSKPSTAVKVCTHVMLDIRIRLL